MNLPMKPSEQLERYRNDSRLVVEANRAANPRVLGSVSRGEDADNSYLDILIDPSDGTTLFDLGAIQAELNELLGIMVDIHTSNSLPKKFRDSVIAQASPI